MELPTPDNIESAEYRVQKFKEGMEKLTKEYKITFAPKIGQDGPFNAVLDLADVKETQNESSTT